MGSAYYITLNSKNPPFDPFTNGKALAKESPKIEKIARQHDLKTFGEFQSYSEEFIQGMMEDAGLEEPPAWWNGEHWFSPTEGREWIHSLIQAVQKESEVFEDSDSIVSELKEYEEVLNNCEHTGLQWHLSLDF